MARVFCLLWNTGQAAPVPRNALAGDCCFDPYMQILWMVDSRGEPSDFQYIGNRNSAYGHAFGRGGDEDLLTARGREIFWVAQANQRAEMREQVKRVSEKIPSEFEWAESESGDIVPVTRSIKACKAERR